MWLWNFAHNVMNMHVWELLGLVVLAAGGITAGIHKQKEKKKAPGEDKSPPAEAGNGEAEV